MEYSHLADKLPETSCRQVIRIGFALVMLVIGFVVILGLARLSTVNNTLSEVVAHDQGAIDALFRMQQSARERSVLLYRIASTKDPLERDEQVIQHGLQGGLFIQASQKLSDLKLDQTEEGLLEQMFAHARAATMLQGQVLDQLAVKDFRRAQEILNKDAVPAQNKILSTIDEMLAYEINKSHKYEDLLQKQQGQTRFLMVAGGMLAAIVVGFIANFISRRIRNLITGLAATAQNLRESNSSLELLKSALDHHSIVSVTDVHGNITYVNDKFCQISQYKKEELIGQNHRILNSGTHPKSFFDDIWSCISAGKIWQGEICNRGKNGALYWVSSTIVPFLDEGGLPYQYISVRNDFTAIKEAEQVLMRGKAELENLVRERTEDLHDREEVLHSITNAAQDAVIMLDSSGNVSYWNPAAEKMFGYSAAEISGRNFHSLVVPSRYLDAHHAAFPKFVQSGSGPLIGAVTEVDALKRDGREFPVEISISGVKIRECWHAVAIVRDITVRRLADENLKRLASTDVLTGACNRRRFNEILHTELARAARYGTPFLLIILDVDYFKHINDTFGHHAGDQVLLKLALLISSNIRDTDTFARWGGEEFTILVTNYETQSPSRSAEKLRKLIEDYPFTEIGKVTCSFGVTEYIAGDDEESILKRADNNLYRAKEAGRNCVILDQG